NVNALFDCSHFIVSSVDMSSTNSIPNSLNLSVTWIKYGSFDFIKISLSFFINASANVSFQINAFFKLSENLSAIEITSPVDFISGTSNGSTPGNLLLENTGAFTVYKSVSASNPNVSYTTSSNKAAVASSIMFTFVTLLTIGTVLEARGFTSSTNSESL